MNIDFEKLGRTNSVYCAEQHCSSCKIIGIYPYCDTEMDIDKDLEQKGKDF